MSDFKGFPAEGPAFYAELEENNTREWWLEHKDVYDTAIREPMLALLDALSGEFGEGKAFRPNRDVRFSKDKSPYKTSQGGFAATDEGTGYYLHLDATGLMVGGGCHTSMPGQVAKFRAAVAAPASGEELVGIVGALSDAGFAIEGERLKTVPREFGADHPRAELLKHKSLTAGKVLGSPEWLGTPEALDRIRGYWSELRPLVEWLSVHVY
ncbi:DUF2461 domain-containing protein [Sinomonas sp. ASV322]|uniref:DUF2461 domain-containing protein n=1 Tax=Sinomonas sp. ASV322 TaxID=3041920 RepID=UPI0027DCD93A|nr:DUF2461 domain-containing protein [Sinomonas sp. ASV322]MDQ4503987.1 DUF2461 domain-containing protein [Sinomonas sp. ASV322]